MIKWPLGSVSICLGSDFIDFKSIFSTMKNAKLSGKGVKSGGPPVFSYEFFILNHADIVSTICIVVFMGLLFKVCCVLLYDTVGALIS